MKKMLTAVLAALMALCLILPAVAEGEVTIGQALYAAHGTKCFAVLTVAMQDGVIADAYIDEFQFMTAGEAVGVPNSDADFGQSYPEGKVLASKRENAEMYSANMAAAGSTVALDVNYDAIEDYVTGKTIEEARNEVKGLNLSIRTIEQANEQPAGTVLSQSPDAGSTVRKSSVITLVVSTGVPEVVATPEPVEPTVNEDGTITVQESWWPSADGSHQIHQLTDGTMWNENGQQCDAQGNPIG